MPLLSFLLKAFALATLAAPLASAGKCKPKYPGKYPDGSPKHIYTYDGGDSYNPINGGGDSYSATKYSSAYPTTFVTKTSQQGNKGKDWDIYNPSTVYSSNSAVVTTAATSTTSTISSPGEITSLPELTDGVTTTTTTTTTTPIVDRFPTSPLIVLDPGPSGFPVE